ncbi:hypothetical protein M8494_11605 [Serratia ureilytica]
MTDAAGNLCWSGQYDTFGKLQGQTVAGAAKRQARTQQPLRLRRAISGRRKRPAPATVPLLRTEVGRFTTQDR